ncbi:MULTISPECIES: hypothetical protein [Paenibacillus]|uniref:hypothetical protein n=1 Tax=Paenibacillus TaxID=44249 RepID=UPI0030F4F924
MLNRTPDMVEWGLMEDVDPADYFGKTIEVERFDSGRDSELNLVMKKLYLQWVVVSNNWGAVHNRLPLFN